MTYKSELVMQKIILEGKKQKDIAAEIGVSQGYVSLINTRLSQILYKPFILDGNITCLRCKKEKEDLVIHHDHITGRPIAILCKKCNRLCKNQTVFDGELSNNHYDVNNRTYTDDLYNDHITVRIPDIIMTPFEEKWKADHPMDTINKRTNTRLIEQIIKDYVNGLIKYDKKRRV